MNNSFLGVPLFVWGAGCLVVAVISGVVWPSRSVASASGFQYVVLRWAHSAVWVLLAVSCFVRGSGAPGSNGLANMLALGALGLYLVFITTLLRG